MRRSLLGFAAAAAVVVAAVIITRVWPGSGGSSPASFQAQAVEANSSASTSGTTSPEPTQSGDVILTITRGGTVLKRWTLSGLKAAVTFKQTKLDGEDQDGPLLLDVLKASGVETWTTGEAIGQGPARASSVSLPLDATKVDDTWILSTTARNTLKLAASNVDRQHWVRDVSEIRVQ